MSYSHVCGDQEHAEQQPSQT
jgi:hypothetical protein